MTLRLSLFVSLFLLSSLSGGATFNGEWVQGALITGVAEPGEKVFLGGQELIQTAAGQFVFGLGRDTPDKVSIVVRHNTNEKVLTFNVKQREYAIQRIEGVAQNHVTPPKEVTQRIQKEAKAVSQARKNLDVRTDYLGTFIWPAKGPITGVYGSQRVYNGTPKNPHFGVDIAGPVGSAVIAPAPGVVTFADKDLYFSGGTLIIDHGMGVSSTFIHLSKIDVKLGDVVGQGDLIARIGATGRATGPHLDWRINWFGERLDPQLLFDEGSKPALH